MKARSQPPGFAIVETLPGGGTKRWETEPGADRKEVQATAALWARMFEGRHGFKAVASAGWAPRKRRQRREVK